MRCRAVGRRRDRHDGRGRDIRAPAKGGWLLRDVRCRNDLQRAHGPLREVGLRMRHERALRDSGREKLVRARCSERRRDGGAGHICRAGPPPPAVSGGLRKWFRRRRRIRPRESDRAAHEALNPSGLRLRGRAFTPACHSIAPMVGSNPGSCRKVELDDLQELSCFHPTRSNHVRGAATGASSPGAAER